MEKVMHLPKLYKKRADGKIHYWQIEVKGNCFRTHSGLVNGQTVTSEWTICLGKGRGASETTPDQQAEKEAIAKQTKRLALGYTANLDSTDEAHASYFHPMLAVKYEDMKKRLEEDFSRGLGVYMQPKLDGMRCIVTPMGMFSRQGKPIYSAPHIYKQVYKRMLSFGVKKYVVDGELYNHDFKKDFNKIISLAKKTKPTEGDLVESEKLLQYHVYDMYSPNLPFNKRYDRLQDIFVICPPSIRLVETWMAYDVPQIEALTSLCLEKGYEGSMIRVNAQYENKRSKFLIKYKNFQDEEFEILSISEGKGNRSGMAGYVTMKTKKGVDFTSSLKGDVNYLRDVLAKRSELIGKQATVKFQNYTPDGAPRFPCVVAIRDYE